MDTTVCEKCGHEMQIGEFPFCPHPVSHLAVAGDEIDIWIRHGICNDDGTPKRYRSKSEIMKAAYEKGYNVGGNTPHPNPRIMEQRQRDKENKRRV